MTYHQPDKDIAIAVCTIKLNSTAEALNKKEPGLQE
jgi:hypothetical protein